MQWATSIGETQQQDAWSKSVLWVVLVYLCPFTGLSNFQLTDIPLDNSFERMTTEIKLAER